MAFMVMEMATCDDDQVLQLEKERKRETKPYGDQGKGINRDFVLVIKTL